MRALHTVLVFPAWRDNPYLNLMSLAPRAGGFAFTGVTTFDSLVTASGRLVAGDLLHLHWTSPILQRAESEADAWAALETFTALLVDLRTRGVRVIWTVHNQLPHELAYRDAEIALHRVLAEQVDAVHIMAPATPRVLAEICELPADRIRQIAHPSYLGVYGKAPSQTEARRALGLAPDEKTVLFLGQIRPYKGLGTLLSAIRALDARGEPVPTLLLAGSATPEAQAEIEAALPVGAKAITRFEFIPDGEVPIWFAAADLAVFPYTAILNSGSLHLSATFDTPVVLPAEPHLVEQFGDEPWVRFFDLADPVASMAGVIAESLRIPASAELSSRFDAFNTAISPWRVSTQYAALLSELSPTEGDEPLQPALHAERRPAGSASNPV
ncbi:glycosyltransferase [Agromyces sp. Leaf222]|uniref:glycosyltransferase n=1 Tax=Agromyces sp. Leaf222 TaxID=1735688 RepID=UPI00138EDF73|nr:glycosyltransferase [Agromyces sp. Leaf222]